MQIDFKKELEIASRGMIMIHDPKLLIKLIIRMIVRKLGVTHAAMILYEPQHDAYVLSISRGQTGIKVPSGFTRFTNCSPLIKFFITPECRALLTGRSAVVADEINQMIWRESVLENGADIRDLLHRVDEQMQMFNSIAAVPAYYHQTLMAVLLLGEKKDGTRFAQEELNFFAALASDTAMAIRNAQLFEGLKAESERNHKLFMQTIVVLGSTIEAKDAYTQGHSESVTRYALAIARYMSLKGAKDINERFMESLYIASLLHDIGKIGIPEAILNKPGRLTEDEFKIMKQHSLQGAEIVKSLSLTVDTVGGIKYHHERYDGTGYPEGKKGDEIPLCASIIAVADAFDAMTSDRPYRKSFPREAAVDELRRHAGTQFHPLVAKVMVHLLEKKVI